MPSFKSPPSLATLTALTAFSTLSLNMFLPSLANIADDLNTSYAIVSFAVSGYLAVTAVIQLIVGPLSDRIGRRPVLLGALGLFAISSLICAVAENITVFLVFRLLQGAMISGYALSLAIVRDTHSEQKAAGLIGYISMAMAVAPMIGPMLGGALDTAIGWRANFYFYAIGGIVLLLVCIFDLGETRPSRTNGIDPTQEKLRTLLSDASFWAYSLCTAFSTGAFYIFLTGAPLVAQSTFGVSTAQLGIYIGSITAGFMTGSFLAGTFAEKFSGTTMMMIGRGVACFGLLVGVTAISIGFVTPFVFFGSTICVGLGNGITMPSSSAAAMSVRPNFAGSAAGWSGALTVALGALLTALTGFILPAQRAEIFLLLLMLVASGLSFAAVLWAIKLKQGNNSDL